MLTLNPIAKQIAFHPKRCCQCGVCLASCPRSALGFKQERQAYEITINPGACTRCGLCVQACPAHAISDVVIPDDQLARARGFVLACAADPVVRRFGSSGGVARALLTNSAENEGFAAVYTLLFPRVRVDSAGHLADIEGEAEGQWTTGRLDSFRIPTSLYRPVLWGKGLLNNTPRAGKVLLVGLPCQIRGARELLARTSPKLEIVAVSIFCRKTKTFDYSRYVLKAAGSTRLNATEKVLYRGEGWPGHFRVLSPGGGQVLSEFFYHASCWNLEACAYCTDCIGWGTADITLADPWGIVKRVDEHEGLSLVYIWSRAGQELLDACRASLQLVAPLTADQVARDFGMQKTRAKEAMTRRLMKDTSLSGRLAVHINVLKSRFAEKVLSFHPRNRFMMRLLRGRTIVPPCVSGNVK